ncbi:MAG: chromate efflux transporter [Acidiferrobacterales bacterium]
MENSARKARSVSKTQHGISFAEAFRVWLRIALLSFGGPAGQIAVMHRILVDEKRWISESRFLHALNYCMLLPGPEAQQLVTYMGWLLHRAIGGLVAGTLFVLPGFIVILVLSVLYAGFSDVSFVQALFFGLKPAVLAVVIHAGHRIGKRVLHNRMMIAIATSAYIAIFFFEAPFPVIIVAAALVGYLGGRFRPEVFRINAGRSDPTRNDEAATIDAALSDSMPAHAYPSLARAVRITALCLALWFGPILVLIAIRGPSDIYVQIGLFFSKVAVVTFGGAYAVLAYVAQQAVDVYGWLQPGEMLDGLGMAETTPGPLIMVLQFVGFMGAFRDPGMLEPMLAGTLAALLATWVTFVPCFLWIFLGAPYVEILRGNHSLNSALSSITAAVVGVVFNLAVWFALHVIFAELGEVHVLGARLFVPVWSELDPASLVLALGALVAMFRFNAGIMPTLAGSAVVGMLYRLAL